MLLPGGKHSCQVQQEVSQLNFDSADADSAYTVSVGVSGVATPLGSKSSDITAEDVQLVALSPAVRHGVRVDETTASPTTVTDAGV
jgi:hypothetical protein